MNIFDCGVLMIKVNFELTHQNYGHLHTKLFQALENEMYDQLNGGISINPVSAVVGLYSL